TAADAMAALAHAGVPAAPVRTPQEAVHDHRVTARGETVAVEHPTRGVINGLRTAGVPVRLSASHVGFDRPAPRLGEHTAEVLGGLAGYDGERLQSLREQGVV
ncbi:MAG: CoA transferase, partial [Solirubrobacteraceae bacterium]